MKIFTGYDNSSKNVTSKASRKKAFRPNNIKNKSKSNMIKNERPNLSASNIREKIRLHKIKNNISTDENSVVEKEVKNIATLGTEKLKDALRTGTVNFDDHTKKILEQILGNKK